MQHLEKLSQLNGLRNEILSSAISLLRLQFSVGDFFLKTELAFTSAALVQGAQAIDRRITFLSYSHASQFKAQAQTAQPSLNTVVQSLKSLEKKLKKTATSFSKNLDSKSSDLIENIASSLKRKTKILNAWAESLSKSESLHQSALGLKRDCYILESPFRSPVYRDLQGFTHTMKDVESRAAYLSSNAYLEIAALDILSDLSLSAFNEQLLPLVFDLSHQLQDEARHAELLAKRLSDLGFELGFVPIELETWRLYKSFDSFSDKIAAQQVLQEGLGLDASHLNVQAMKGAGDLKSADLYAQITADEVNHVALGMKWLNHFSPGQAESVLARVDQECRMILKRPLDMPLSLELRRKAAMPETWLARESQRCGTQSFDRYVLENNHAN
jgi:uncharacterized ferritin-like protein (DUF455 family)